MAGVYRPRAQHLLWRVRLLRPEADSHSERRSIRDTVDPVYRLLRRRRRLRALAECPYDGPARGHTSVRANAGTIPLRPDPEDRTVAQLLKESGYATGLFGKWGLGDFGSTGTPDKKGFDEYYGFLHQVHPHNYYTDFLWRNGKKEILSGNRDGK